MFTYHHAKNESFLAENLESVKITGADKRIILLELRKMAISYDELFPDCDGLCLDLNFINQNIDLILR
jgi:hypothetical protein